jgi:hypothetical protein
MLVVSWLSVLVAVESSFACGLPAPPCVVVAVAVCVVVASLPLLPLLLVGLANADPDANMKAIAVAKVLLVIEISPFMGCGARENLEPADRRSSRRVVRD